MSNTRRAFTLIELLVVIAIIAILAAILFPVFAQAKQAAKKTADLSNLKQLGTALAIYQGDYDDHWPYADSVPAGWVSGTNYGDMYRWSSAQVIGPYEKSVEMLSSPLDAPYTPNPTFSAYFPTPPRKAKPISYIANSFSNDTIGAGSAYFPATVADYRGPIATGSYWARGPLPANAPTEAPVSSTEPTNPSSLIVLAGGSVQEDNFNFCPGSTNTETFSGCFGTGDLVWGWDGANLASGTYFGSANADALKAWRKGGNGSNFSFADTHAKNMAPGSLMTGPFQLNPKYFLVNSTGF